MLNFPRMLALRSHDPHVRRSVQDAVYREYDLELYRFCYSVCRNLDGAFDVVQEAFDAFFDRARTAELEVHTNIRAYLIKCARHGCLPRSGYKTQRIPIDKITPGNPTRVTTMGPHRLNNHRRIEICGTNCRPEIDGEYRRGNPRPRDEKSNEEDGSPQERARTFCVGACYDEIELGIEVIRGGERHCGAVLVRRSRRTNSLPESVEHGKNSRPDEREKKLEELSQMFGHLIPRLSDEHQKVMNTYIEFCLKQGKPKQVLDAELGLSTKTVSKRLRSAQDALARLVIEYSDGAP